MVTSINPPLQDGLFGVDDIVFFDGTDVLDGDGPNRSLVKGLFR